MYKDRILDLGVGKGGSYLKLDKNNQAFRVGADVNRIRLKSLKKRFPEVKPCETDLKGPVSPSLPFAPQSFNRVELRFPHDDLLWWLTNNDKNLWNEFKRVLKPSGSVFVIFDVPPDGIRTLKVKGKDKSQKVKDPEDHIWRQAVDSGFRVEINPFTKQESYDMGSDYGKRIANWIKVTQDKHKAYTLKASLQSQ